MNKRELTEEMKEKFKTLANLFYEDNKDDLEYGLTWQEQYDEFCEAWVNNNISLEFVNFALE